MTSAEQFVDSVTLMVAAISALTRVFEARGPRRATAVAPRPIILRGSLRSHLRMTD
jgi:hypothetical protein